MRLRRARPQGVDDAAPRPVDAGQPEHLHPLARVLAEVEPGALGLHAAQASLRDRPRRARLVDPLPLPVAIDADGGEIADPGEIAEPRKLVAEMAQHHVAFEVRRNADERVRRPRQQALDLGGGGIALELREPAPRAAPHPRHRHWSSFPRARRCARSPAVPAPAPSIQIRSRRAASCRLAPHPGAGVTLDQSSCPTPTRDVRAALCLSVSAPAHPISRNLRLEATLPASTPRTLTLSLPVALC